ncbi:phage tail protein [Pseudomonas sp. 5P_3.1_Bac2]|uniref:phage tail protein n=1 Tax=Pseudomonas sp. 5P_3.1_Bac2 TaxID=2971617 RepID=UPI0021C77738|nr:phage tail protein [Pseudomonas sp. 5P_3.1_Bac2]MCU1717425.1 phage tail protein [Pseudomonas sp. 5P_3.1_Bac2]
MNKPDALRQHLLAAIPELEQNPQRLALSLEQGQLRSTAAGGLSFEYSYVLNLNVSDFSASLDALVVPLLAWLRVNQHELLANQSQAANAIRFSSDNANAQGGSLSISLALSERVLVTENADGSLSVSHPDEPQLAPFYPPGPWQLSVHDMPLASWHSTYRSGGDVASPHPIRTKPAAS